MNEPRLFAPPPCSPPRSCPGRPARSLCGAGNRPPPLTRGAFRRRLGAGREALAGRVTAIFFGFRFSEPNSFRNYFSEGVCVGGVRTEEGAERGQRSGAFPHWAFGAARGARATARKAGSAGGCAPGRRGPTRPLPSVLSREVVGGGGLFAGSGFFRSALATRLGYAPGPNPASLRAPRRPRARRWCWERRPGRDSVLVHGGRPKRGRVLRCIS